MFFNLVLEQVNNHIRRACGLHVINSFPILKLMNHDISNAGKPSTFPPGKIY